MVETERKREEGKQKKREGFEGKRQRDWRETSDQVTTDTDTVIRQLPSVIVDGSVMIW